SRSPIRTASWNSTREPSEARASTWPRTSWPERRPRRSTPPRRGCTASSAANSCGPGIWQPWATNSPRTPLPDWRSCPEMSDPVSPNPVPSDSPSPGDENSSADAAGRRSSLARPLSSTAVMGAGSLSETPLHYGASLREQRVLEEQDGLVDLPHLRVLRLSGPDRLTWLNSIATQKIDTLAPGVSTE